MARPMILPAYLADFDAPVEELGRRVPDIATFVLGRGSSLAAAWTGALIIKEAAGRPVEAMSVPQFRHGPLEMAGPNVAAVILAGSGNEHPLNRRMHDDLVGYGAEALWLASGSTSPSMPDLTGVALPLGEVVPLQLLSVMFAERSGRVPGEFHRISKVTSQRAPWLVPLASHYPEEVAAQRRSPRGRRVAGSSAPNADPPRRGGCGHRRS